MSKPSSKGFMFHVCRSAGGIRLLMTLSVSVAVLMLLWLPFISPDTGTGAIVLLNLIIAIVFVSFFGLLLLLCRRQQRDVPEEPNPLD
ncbi:hypothetical protein [Haloarchaeobius sp. HME9146]|uniref:hypothetical protein n=1 Tax=Haloarchaeobius sp. HME9146 TaxID=2978732 RepID=UPI0021C18F4C|nr:hypothetical protein [Haloarchaeobius sp. HME9146]MCT9098024.1 hypothetical protein [Haloarchaeobius sp. HME9146]